jgi:hypothetical protein
MSAIPRSLSTIPLLLRDERSAVRIKAAAMASLVILGTVATGLLLMSLSDGLYERRAYGRLLAGHDAAAATWSV